MERNVILKDLLQTSALINAKIKDEQILTGLLEGVSPFNLFNIIGKNRLFIVALVLFVIYSWFIRANISLGSIFGFLFLGFLYYIYFQYEFYNIKGFTENKQQKINFLAQMLAKNNVYPIEGAISYNDNYLKMDSERQMNYLYFNPAVVDFFYNNRIFINHSMFNYSKSLAYINAMILLHNDILTGVNARGNQFEELEFLRQQCLNYWQAIIYKLPSTRTSYIKFQESQKILGELTQNLIDTAQIKIEQINGKVGMNMEYYPIVKTGPKPNDVGTYGFNAHFDFYN